MATSSLWPPQNLSPSFSLSSSLQGRRRPNASRELSVLERLGGRVQSGEVALHLGDALAALVTTRRYRFRFIGVRPFGHRRCCLEYMEVILFIS